MDSPQENEDKINKVLTGWKNHAEGATLSEMTLAQFTAKVKPSLDKRTAISDLEDQIKALANERDDADKVSMKEIKLVVNAVKGSHAYGEDSSLYESFGYKRESERKSGLTRKTAEPGETPKA